jgi:predicted RNA-binding protein with PIN domain
VPYLIDGNNLLGSWGGCGAKDRRWEVVQRVAGTCRKRGLSATLVFDGAPFRTERQALGALRLCFPRVGQDADTVIRALVDGSPSPSSWTVVTSDKALYSYVRTRGARVMRAHEWNALERKPASSVVDASEKPDRERDVGEWLQRFGGQAEDDATSESEQE